MTTRRDILEYYHTTADKEYDTFNRRIVCTSMPTVGVRVPLMRNLAKDVLRNNPEYFLTIHQTKFYEDALLEALVIAGLKCDHKTIRPHIERFVPTIECWATCDVFCGSLKRTKKELPQFWPLIEQYLKSDQEFQIRWAVVMMMCYYLTDNYIDDVITRWTTITNNHYYVEMAIAWGLATAFVKYPQKVYEALSNNHFTERVLKKTVRKCQESFRVSAQDKQLLKKLVSK